MLPELSLLLTVATALAAILACIALAAWVVRRSGWVSRPVAGRELAVRETIALDPRRRLHLVRCGEQSVLLLTGGPQDAVVGWLPPAGPRPDGAT